MTAKLKIVTATHRPVVDNRDWILPRETAAEIAARIREGKGPLRHLVFRETIDGEQA